VHVFSSILTLLLLFGSSLAHAVFERDRDLLSLHVDHALNPMASHVVLANHAIAHTLSLQMVVVTHDGMSNDHDLYHYFSMIDASADLVSSDAGVHSDQALQSTVAYWSHTLNAGADVWVLELGQADFTAAVIQQIRLRLPSIDTGQRIHVLKRRPVDESRLDTSALSFVQLHSNMILIDAPNDRANRFNLYSELSADWGLSNEQVNAWQQLVVPFDPNGEINRSDAAEMLYILSTHRSDGGWSDTIAQHQSKDQISTPPESPQYWTDSYSVDGQCFCDTTFDHELDGIEIDTPSGRLPVYQVCADIQQKHGEGSQSGRLYYNTVQCGHEPANNSPDEIDCPGFLTDDTGAKNWYNCSAKGANWNLDQLYSDSGDSVPRDSSSSSIALCQLATSDPDRNGFGWENGALCQVPTLVDPLDDNIVAHNVVTLGGGSLSLPWLVAFVVVGFARRVRRRAAS